jgi:hypothetical protein
VAEFVEGEAGNQEERKKSRKRRLAWVQRDQDNNAKKWQPLLKRARTSAYCNTRYLDNQLIQSIGKGLAQYMQPEAVCERVAPKLWPQLTVSWDPEATKLVGDGFIMRELQCCVEVWWDLSNAGETSSAPPSLPSSRTAC